MSESEVCPVAWNEYSRLGIQERLQFWISLPKGMLLHPTFNDVNQWDGLVRDVCTEALEEIRTLRKLAGAVSTDAEDLAAIKNRVHPGRRRE